MSKVVLSEVTIHPLIMNKFKLCEELDKKELKEELRKKE
jgi:hypothetical protein